MWWPGCDEAGCRVARTRACVGVTAVCAAAVCALGPAAHTLSLGRCQPGLAIAHQLARLATCAGAVARTLGDDQVHAHNKYWMALCLQIFPFELPVSK